MKAATSARLIVGLPFMGRRSAALNVPGLLSA
jgi:hypothetical protein